MRTNDDSPEQEHSETSFLSGDSWVNSSEQDGLPSRPRSIVDSPERQRRVISSRPSLDLRSHSLPYAAQTSRSAPTDQPKHSPTLSRFNTAVRAQNPERQWTLFGQVMENEQRGTNPRRLTRLPSEFMSPQEALGGYFPPATALNGGASRVQSPVQEHPTAAGAPDDMTISTDYASDSEDSDDSGVARSSHQPDEPLRWYSPKRIPFPTITNVHRNVFKCVVAYFIASLFTFSPIFASWISDITTDNEPGQSRPSPSGHMVATVAVYFNPAKTIGGMVEADGYCLLGLVYAAIISLASMSMFWWIDVKPGLQWLASLLAILWIGFGMAGVSWTKAWMDKPSFGTACSMTVIVLFVVVVNEGGLDTLQQVSLIVVVGALCSNLVCYIIWPQSATVNLQENMTKTLDSFSTLLQMLTSTFLLEEPIHVRQEKLQKAIDSHQASFTSLKKNLKEAHSEWFYGGPSGSSRLSSGKAYEDAVDCLNRLAQHLNGLRSGIRLQFDLTKAHTEGKVVIKGRTSKMSSSFTAKAGRSQPEESEEDNELLQAAAHMFGDLVDDLGPPMNALSTTCTSALKRLREAFVKRRRTAKHEAIKPQEFLALVDGIERALFTFESTSNHALMRLYQRSNISASPSRVSLKSLLEDNQAKSGGDSETVFLVYFFIFTLQEFAQELISLVDAMSRIYNIEREQAARGSWARRVVVDSYSSVRTIVRRFWRANRPSTRPGKQRPTLQKRLCSSAYSSGDPTDAEDLLLFIVAAIMMPQGKHKKPFFPKVRPHAPNTVHTPHRSNLPFMGRVQQRLWAFGERVQERDIKYAFKAGMGMAILAAPAYFDPTRDVFMEYRGEWALISFFLVISPTIGATNFLSFHRIIGTLMGAAVAGVFFQLFSGNPYVLSILGALYSIPCFYYIVTSPRLASPARFNLLTYNLICLFCYNLREQKLSVLDIALHRSIAVIIGVVWAAILARFWWPAQARRELSRSLGEFCLNIGWLYTRLVASYSFAPEMHSPNDDNDDDDDNSNGDSTLLLSNSASSKLNNSIQEFMAMELHLQIQLIELQGLLAQTQHEPRLKGPFPVALYRSILTSLQTVLDKLHSMRCVTTREEWFTTVRTEFIIPVNKERHEMVGNIILYFSTLAAAFRLKAPLPPYLPPAEKSRQRLVEAIRRLEVVKNRDVKGSRQLLFFAYTLMMQGVIQELDYLGRTLQTAFGVIGESPAEFEALFRDQGRTMDRIV